MNDQLFGCACWLALYIIGVLVARDREQLINTLLFFFLNAFSIFLLRIF